MSEKPHKGKIHNWQKHLFNKEAVALRYGEDVGLGYVIKGTVYDHPVFGHPDWFHTSWGNVSR